MYDHDATSHHEGGRASIILARGSLEEAVYALADHLEDSATPTPAESVSRDLLGEELERAFARLTPREQTVIVLRFGIGDGYGHTLADWRYQHSGGLATSRHARAGGSQTCSLFCGTLPARAWHHARNDRRASCTKK